MSLLLPASSSPSESGGSSSRLDLYASVAEHSEQHLVALQSVEDDGLGEEPQIVWELVPGALTYDTATLPDPTRGFDDPKRLDAFLDAVRWAQWAGAIRELLAAGVMDPQGEKRGTKYVWKGERP